MITDIHCHFIPDGFFKFVQGERAYDIAHEATDGEEVTVRVGGLRFGLNRTFFDAGRQIARMDALGVEHTVISLATPLINYAVDGATATKASRLCNDGLAEVVAGHPERFSAWAFLAIQDPVAAAAELRRCVKEHGVVGGHIASNVQGKYLDAEEFRPIFDAAVELDVPLFVHPADPPGKDRTRNYELTVVAGYLFDTTINVFQLICSGFLDRYPTLKLVCAHSGAYSLMLRARMQREIDTNPVLSKTVKRRVADYLRQLYFDTVCFEPGYLHYAASVVPIEHFMMGSDGPFALGEPDPVGFVRESIADPDRLEKVLGGNFARLTAG
jgi:aminocarboxymuconate-semialdehyde decarboxylase